MDSILLYMELRCGSIVVCMKLELHQPLFSSSFGLKGALPHLESPCCECYVIVFINGLHCQSDLSMPVIHPLPMKRIQPNLLGPESTL